MKPSLEIYLKYLEEFSLGHLTTESFHTKSENLSYLAKTNIRGAIDVLQEIDFDALNILRTKSHEIYRLGVQLQETISKGHKIYISGCGATGRLAISLEKIFREMFQSESVIGFMAGGDYALVHSVESFEDSSLYGKRQLQDLGFSEGDFLLGVTEGGETSFVIGTVEMATELSSLSPYFIYCNPDHELKMIKRSSQIIANSKVCKLNLTIGPMAISGSTRMQATTVQMLAIGFALLEFNKDENKFTKHFNDFISDLTSIDYHFFEEFIKHEAYLYQKNAIITYLTDPVIAACILTDTTERSPTFSLSPFEKITDAHTSLSYLAVKGTSSSKDAWESVLGRRARCIDWKDLHYSISENSLLEFDVSEKSIIRRSMFCEHKSFSILRKGEYLIFELDKIHKKLHLKSSNLFFHHMVLKLLLNTHSTLIMGILERYEGNMMTYVRASNLKLVNRAFRYINHLLEKEKIQIPQEEILKMIFELDHDKNHPLVLNVYQKAKKRFLNNRYSSSGQTP